MFSSLTERLTTADRVTVDNLLSLKNGWNWNFRGEEQEETFGFMYSSKIPRTMNLMASLLIF